MVTVRVKRASDSVALPQYMTSGASGCDVGAFLSEPIELLPLQRVAVPTGLFFEIPPGFEIQVRPRSGLALKQGLTVVNAPGTIDSDYRGELKVLVVNLSDTKAVIRNGDRIAQLVLAESVRANWEEVSNLTDSVRAEGGFGSTGVEQPRV